MDRTSPYSLLVSLCRRNAVGQSHVIIFARDREFRKIDTSNCGRYVNPLNPELNPICYLLALLGAHHFLHVSRIRVKLLTLR